MRHIVKVLINIDISAECGQKLTTTSIKILKHNRGFKKQKAPNFLELEALPVPLAGLEPATHGLGNHCS
ncbi:MAG: hypothetical protein ACE5JB_14965, partial [bacterium]